jgi:hypothetical protein
MKILDIIYPYFTLQFAGLPFEVKEERLGTTRWYTPTNPERDKTPLHFLTERYDAETIQALIMVCVDSFEEEMRIILNEHDQDEAEYQTMSYSERYIKHMVGH